MPTQKTSAIAVEIAALATLVSVLTPGQVDALNGPGPLTVFTPTNDGFSAIQATVDGLSATEVEAIENHHVVAGAVSFANILATTGCRTLAGHHRRSK